MNTHLACVGVQDAFLFQPWAADMARNYFGAQLVDALPKYVRGKHAGALKGMIRWHKVQRGGWVRDGFGDSGRVEKRVGQIIHVELLQADWGKEPVVLHSWQLDAVRYVDTEAVAERLAGMRT